MCIVTAFIIVITAVVCLRGQMASRRSQPACKVTKSPPRGQLTKYKLRLRSFMFTFPLAVRHAYTSPQDSVPCLPSFPLACLHLRTHIFNRGRGCCVGDYFGIELLRRRHAISTSLISMRAHAHTFTHSPLLPPAHG